MKFKVLKRSFIHGGICEPGTVVDLSEEEVHKGDEDHLVPFAPAPPPKPPPLKPMGLVEDKK